MEVFDAVRTVLAVRQFQDKPIPEPIVRQIVEAGRLTASSMNGQPWHFIVVRERERLKRLSELGPFAVHLAGAAFAVVFASPDPTGRWSIAFDLGQAAAYMQLAAWELGVGSCIASIYEPDKAKAMLGAPDDLHLQMALSFGYPAQVQDRPPRKGGRRSLAEVVHWEQW